MGNIVDSNAMYRIGKSMAAEGVRDNRQRDAFMGFLGGQALNQLGKAFQTRKALKTAGSATVTNTKLSVDEGNYDENMLAIATDVINNGKANLNKGANMTAIGKTGKGTELINTTNAELKRLVSGMEHVKSKVDLWKDIYTTGNFTGKDGNTMKVSVNGASSAQSQDLAASFADGSIYQSMDFRDGKWGLVGEETIVGGIKNPTFTLLEDLKLPELDESKMINDYSKGLNADFERLGYNNKTGNWSEYEETTRDNIFNDFQNMTENQISSKWFSENGNDKTTPALKYLMQEGGYSINGEQYDALLDPNEMNISADEQAQRQVLATGALEMLKLEDLDNYEKTTWLINNEILPSAKENFERGFNQKPDKKTSSVKKGGGKVNLGKDNFGQDLGHVWPADMKRKAEEVDGAEKIGSKINHLLNDNIYAELIRSNKLDVDDPNFSENAQFILFDGETNDDDPKTPRNEQRRGKIFTADQIKRMFKVDDLEMGTDSAPLG